VNSELEQAYIDSLTQQVFPGPEMEVAGTVRPGAMQGEMSAIEQTTGEKVMEGIGTTLERAGQMIDQGKATELGRIFSVIDEWVPGTLNEITGKQIPIIGDMRLRDLMPFVGSTEQVQDPMTGEMITKEIGTPQAFKMAGRGESLTTGTGFTTQLKSDPKMAALELGMTVAPGIKPAVGKLAEVGREMATIPPTGAVQLAPTPVQAPRSELGFYSAVEETVANLPQAKGTGQQFLAQISKTAGVKPEEIQWTGLDEFLKGKKSVTKQEVQDYLAANRVDVREVRLGDSPFLEQAFNDRFARRGFSMVQTDDGPQFTQTDMTGRRQLTYGELPEDIQATIQNQIVPGTNFGKYTLPGGENYREILLTLPSSRPSIKNMSPAEYNAAVEAADRAGVQDFRTTHFDQPNILAHLRVNDRTVDGKKTLFVEEIQSDWHQAGRKKGYKSEIDPNENASLVKQYDSLTAKRRQIEEIVATGDDASPVTQNAIQNLNQINAELERVSDRLSEIRTAAREGVPDAPFKTSWHELSLKRAIQEAAEKGYDQIAFTTGKTQAERYDLSKQIDEINVVGRTNAVTGEKSKSVALDTVDGQSIRLGVAPDGTVDNVNDQAMNNLIGKNLDEVVGKELAKKIIEGGSQTISGEGLKVGGEGMKGFYDNILPKSLDKLGKKFDAKVTKTTMKAGESSLQPSMVRTETGTELRATAKAAPEVEIWKMDITPKMRESVVSKGQPLFVAPIVAPGMMQEEETK
jgi:hypothetical protein